MELTTNIRIIQFSYPLLHAQIGRGNYFLNSFFNWEDYRIENAFEE